MVERDEYFYGRGAYDNKAGAAILVSAFLRLKREGYKPDRDLILALTADEEAGEEASAIAVFYDGLDFHYRLAKALTGRH